MKKIALVTSLLSSLLFASDDLELMLEQYNKENELYKQTVNKAAGNIIVFSREDLDNMQANTLNDVLNTIRMFTLQRSRLGETQIVKASAGNSIVSPVKIFINSHELNNVTFGNPVAQYGSMNLYYIDHIEIYQAGSSVSFGNESSGMIIKLYTKDPLRENGIFGQFSIDNLGSTRFDFIDANALSKKYSYLINLDINQKNSNDNVDNYTLQRDSKKLQFFTQFRKKDDYIIEFGYMYERANPYATFSLYPVKDQMQIGDNFYLYIDKKFVNGVKVKLSTSLERVFLDYKNSTEVNFSNGVSAKNIQARVNTKYSKLSVEKKSFFKNSKLFTSLSVKRAQLEVEKFKLEDKSQDSFLVDPKRDLLSINAEDIYNLSSNHMLTFGFKYDIYKPNYAKESKNFIYRVGHIYHTEKFSSKLFVFNRIVEPTIGQASFNPLKVKSNSNLKSAKVDIWTFDFLYNLNSKVAINSGIGSVHVKDAITIDKQKKQFVNSSTTVDYTRFILGIKYQYDLYNKYYVEYFRMIKDKKISPSSGALVQISNKINKFTIYNELVYRSAYTNELGQNIDAGYDYTLALGYKYSKRLNIKLKGENLLNKASEIYIYDDPNSGFFTPARDKRVLLSMEYSFK